MKIIKVLLVFLFISSMATAQQIELTQYATGLSSPVDITHAGDDRLFVVERSGRIKIIDGTGTVLSQSFLDIDNLVGSGSGQSERGLLGLAFHPDYANNGYFYVNFTGNNGATNVARYSVDAGDPNVADANSGMTILTVDQPYGNHNGGSLKFGPDGYLYIGLGDGGNANDPGNRAQNPQNLLGKMLRIDVDGGTPYAIPADNPFVGDPNTLDEIWALGLRNPWKYSFDKETGDLWIGDVGQGLWEEINFESIESQGGLNYGWRCYEGDATFNTNGCGDASEYTNPAIDYNHSGFTHCSVTGGYVYRGCDNPGLIGKYLYADYCSGQLWSLLPDGAGGWINEAIGVGGSEISSFGEDVNGEVYIARLGNGRIYKINAILELTQTDNTLNGPEGYASYQWYLNGNLIAGAESATLEISASGEYSLEVGSANGCLQTSAIFVATVAVDDLAAFESFTVSPNPFSETITLNMVVNTSTDLTIQVLDINGKVLLVKDQTINGNTTELLKLKQLPSGIYFVNLITEEGTISRKIVKE